MEAKNEERRKKYDAEQSKMRIKQSQEAISNALYLTSMFSDQNEKMFNLNKGLAIAQATINTFQGVTKAYAQGGVLGMITGTLIAGIGAAQVAGISNTSYKKAALGADFVTDGRTNLLVGDNPGGKERVQVTPINSENRYGNKGSDGAINADFSVVINGNADSATVEKISDNQEKQLANLKEMLTELNFRGQGVVL